MKEEKIRKLVKEKIDSIFELSDQVGDCFDKETIHEFRTATKSLRSFLRLLRTNSGTPEPKLSKRFKRLYHIAGSLRDAQLESETIINKKLAFPAYLNKLQHLINNQEKEWNKHYSEKIMRKLTSRITDTKYQPLHTDVLEAFINTRIAVINRLSNAKDPSDIYVHDIRKNIKDLLYITKIAQKKWKASHKLLEQLPMEQMGKLATVIGHHHDDVVMLTHLRSFSSKTMGTDEKNEIKKFCVKETKRLKIEKKNIIVSIKKLIASLQK